MTVKELIEWLKTQDQEALVQVVELGVDKFPDGEVYTFPAMVAFDVENPDLWQYIDFRKPPVPDYPTRDERYLILGNRN